MARDPGGNLQQNRLSVRVLASRPGKGCNPRIGRWDRSIWPKTGPSARFWRVPHGPGDTPRVSRGNTRDTLGVSPPKPPVLGGPNPLKPVVLIGSSRGRPGGLLAIPNGKCHLRIHIRPHDALYEKKPIQASVLSSLR